ncbi:Por secretion system C-terminal sorting domain-containing protein [Candidatus Kryptobacter tengchongensis]|nr:Por secretion system C-terminal sorting domain-containing protein [Candidatus Kryptobacter tengchongensis]
MKRIFLTIGIIVFAFSFAMAQITIDGIIQEAQYALIATKQNNNQGFGPNIDIQKIYYYPDVSESKLYIGVVCKLNTASNDGIGIWLNIKGSGSNTGRSAGQPLGIGSGGYHYIGANNSNYKADFEVDFMFAFNPGNSTTTVYFDAAKWISNTSYVHYQGFCDQSGTSATNFGEDGTVFTQNSVTFAFNNSGSTNTGLEISIPFSQLGPNVTASNTFEIFAFVVSNTAYFSNVTVPGNVSVGNLGFDPDFGSISGGPYHTAEYSLPVQSVLVSAISGDSKVTLVWETRSEFDNAGFEIFRKAQDETEHKLISSYTTNDALKGLGTSPYGKRYTYVDYNVRNGVEYEYKIYAVSFSGQRQEIGVVFAKPGSELPDKFVLYQNYPNPFNPGTEIKFDLPESGYVKLEVFNAIGERVSILYDGYMEAGYSKTIRWNASGLPSGVYFYKLTAGKFVDVKKMVLVR